MSRLAKRRRLIVKALRPFGRALARREGDAANFPVERANSRMGGPFFYPEPGFHPSCMYFERKY